MSAIAVETLGKPYLGQLPSFWRQLTLRLAPIIVCAGFTFPLFPIAVLYLAPSVDHHDIGAPALTALSVIGGVGSGYAYDLWEWVIPLLKKRIKERIDERNE